MLTPTRSNQEVRAVNDRINDERTMRMTKSKAVPKPLKSGRITRPRPELNCSSPRDSAILQ
jgi:hypothetical protein